MSIINRFISISLWMLYAQAQTAIDIQFLDNSYSTYTISVNNEIWLTSGTTGFRNQNEWVSLQFNHTKNITGQDIIGAYTEFIIVWNNAKNSSNIYETIIRQYPNEPDIIIFTQSFPTGTTKATTNNPDKIISSFPSFLINNKNLGYVKWSGQQIGGNTQIGIFDSQVNKAKIQGGRIETGPMALFNQNMTECIVISALTDHMAASDFTANNTEIQYGLIGNISTINPGFRISFILSGTRNGGGVNTAMKRWGDFQLRHAGGKQRGNSHLRDYTLNYLGYSTDNGAYYYYYTEPQKNYQQTMIDIKTYHDKVGLPTKYVLLDSWWYYKGVDNGVKNWTAMPQIFPGGMKAVYEGTKWKIQAHNRFWSLDNVYANNIPPYDKHSTGNFTFTYGTKDSLPTQLEFWEYLFDINMDWGLSVYEQDWLSTVEGNVYELSSSATFGMQWLTQMAIAAKDHDINVQYCMSYPRNIMSSVGLQAVTQARASHDYHPGNDQWQIGISSVFLSAVDLGPSKDSYWSMNSPQAGHYPAGTYEPYNRLEAVVLSLSNGPVTFADRIGYSNVSLIMKCCTSQGLLLRPDVSATMIDKYFLYNSTLNDSKLMGKGGRIWSTYSQIGENEMYRYLYVFGVNLDKGYDVYLEDIRYQLRGDNMNMEYLVYEVNTTSVYKRFDKNNALNIAAGNEYEFQLYTLIPIGNDTSNNEDIWYLAGEIDKWITVSRQRFHGITRNNDGGIHVTVNGDYNEVVNVAFVNVNGETMKQQIVTCKINESQQVIIHMPDALCLNY
eukprot:255414_1